MEIKDVKWKRVHNGLINEPLIDYLEKLIDEQYEMGRHLKFCIGTDSQKKGNGYTYAISIIIEMKLPMGKLNGKEIYKGLGAKVISGTFYEKYKPSIRERMLKEVQTTINLAYHILDLIELYDIDLEIHADVNPNPKWASNVAYNEVSGYCEAMNLTYKVKPDAYAASHSADRWAHKGIDINKL